MLTYKEPFDNIVICEKKNIETIVVYNTLDKSKYRCTCWDLSKRGAVGETALHLCLLNATSQHAELAKRLVYHFPRLINDIYISEEYYGK